MKNKQIEEYLKQRLLISDNETIFTKFNELVSVVSQLVLIERDSAFKLGRSEEKVQRIYNTLKD